MVEGVEGVLPMVVVVGQVHLDLPEVAALVVRVGWV
jgi:hypothetical protein